MSWRVLLEAKPKAEQMLKESSAEISKQYNEELERIYQSMYLEIKERLKERFVEVVRCKDCCLEAMCEYRIIGEMNDNDFCSYGRRKK